MSDNKSNDFYLSTNQVPESSGAGTVRDKNLKFTNQEGEFSGSSTKKKQEQVSSSDDEEKKDEPVTTVRKIRLVVSDRKNGEVKAPKVAKQTKRKHSPEEDNDEEESNKQEHVEKKIKSSSSSSSADMLISPIDVLTIIITPPTRQSSPILDNVPRCPSMIPADPDFLYPPSAFLEQRRCTAKRKQEKREKLEKRRQAASNMLHELSAESDLAAATELEGTAGPSGVTSPEAVQEDADQANDFGSISDDDSFLGADSDHDNVNSLAGYNTANDAEGDDSSVDFDIPADVNSPIETNPPSDAHSFNDVVTSITTGINLNINVNSAAEVTSPTDANPPINDVISNVYSDVNSPTSTVTSTDIASPTDVANTTVTQEEYLPSKAAITSEASSFKSAVNKGDHTTDKVRLPFKQAAISFDKEFSSRFSAIKKDSFSAATNTQKDLSSIKDIATANGSPSDAAAQGSTTLQGITPTVAQPVLEGIPAFKNLVRIKTSANGRPSVTEFICVTNNDIRPVTIASTNSEIINRNEVLTPLRFTVNELKSPPSATEKVKEISPRKQDKKTIKKEAEESLTAQSEPTSSISLSGYREHKAPTSDEVEQGRLRRPPPPIPSTNSGLQRKISSHSTKINVPTSNGTQRLAAASTRTTTKTPQTARKIPPNTSTATPNGSSSTVRTQAINRDKSKNIMSIDDILKGIDKRR